MKHRTLRSNLILLAVLLLALSALLMSACGNDHSSATLDGTTEASQEAPTDAAETTEAPSDTAPPTEVEPSTPTEIEPSSPTETDPAPSKENEEPTTYAPRDPEAVEIVTLNPEGLSAEKLAVLQRYLTDLAVVQDASALDYVADEIKAKWDYLPYAELKYTCYIIWDEENEFVLSSYRRSGKTVGDGLRYDLIVFRKEGGQWMIAQDVYSDLWMMSDVSDETTKIVSEVFRKAREARPITEEEIEDARAAALKAVVDYQWGWSDSQKRTYERKQEVFYYPDWSDENLPLVLSWTYDYRVPALLFIDHDTYSFEQTIIVYVSLENGEWVGRFLGTRYQPDPPAQYPGKKPN